MLGKTKVTTQALKGFEHVNRYFDPRMNTIAAKILPGECYVTTKGEMIVTVLGSCIAACIRDQRTGIGGMNHFMLPVQSEFSEKNRDLSTSELCYGNWAMEFLINEIIKQGGKKSNFEVKLFGGGQMLNGASKLDVGGRNISFVREFLACEGLDVVAEDLGDEYSRKVLYFPDTGAVKLRKMRKVDNNTIEQREKAYIESMKEKPSAGDVELW